MARSYDCQRTIEKAVQQWLRHIVIADIAGQGAVGHRSSINGYGRKDIPESARVQPHNMLDIPRNLALDSGDMWGHKNQVDVMVPRLVPGQ